MFVQPSQVAAILKRHPEIAKARLVVTGTTGDDRMTLHCETAPGSGTADREAALVASIREATRLRGDVAWFDPGTLPNDGKVIEDQRRHD